MAGGSASPDFLNHLNILTLIGPVGDLSDAHLLRRFVAGPEAASQAAFTALVDRHGPMVMRVCRQVLDDSHDAQDAFQATFLVLARRAGEVRKSESLASWLHGVAVRVAARAKAEVARRRTYEHRGAAMKAAGRGRQDDQPESWPELHEEIARLPERYREPIVLCYLEGISTEAAARRIGCPKGTVLSRLARGRERLRARLTRRGLWLAAGTPAECFSSKALFVSAELAGTTAQAVVRAVASGSGVGATSAAVIRLAEGAISSMRLAGLKIAATLLVVGVATGAVVLAQQEHRPEQRAALRERLSAPRPIQDLKPRHEAREELAKIQGVWARVSMETQGRRSSNDGANWTATYEGDQLILRSNGKHYREAIVTLDPTRTPKAMNTWDVDGATKDKTYPGIYEIDGDTMRVCFAHPGDDRPAEFSTTRGTGFLYYIYERQKP